MSKSHQATKSQLAAMNARPDSLFNLNKRKLADEKEFEKNKQEIEELVMQRLRDRMNELAGYDVDQFVEGSISSFMIDAATDMIVDNQKHLDDTNDYYDCLVLKYANGLMAECITAGHAGVKAYEKATLKAKSPTRGLWKIKLWGDDYRKWYVTLYLDPDHLTPEQVLGEELAKRCREGGRNAPGSIKGITARKGGERSNRAFPHSSMHAFPDTVETVLQRIYDLDFHNSLKEKHHDFERFVRWMKKHNA